MLLILVVMWVAVLLPPYLRNRGGSGSGSMHSFRRKLDTLERTSPFAGSKGHVSAYLPVDGRSIRGPQPLDGPLPAGARHPLQHGGGPRLVPVPTEGVQVIRPAGLEPEAVVDEDAAYLLAPTADPLAHEAGPVRQEGGIPPSVLAARAARKRRREVLYTLLASCGVTLLMFFVVGPAALVLHLLCDLALGGYVYLLVNAQRAKAERDIKVAFLPHQNHDAEPTRLLEAGGGWQPGDVLRQSAN